MRVIAAEPFVGRRLIARRVDEEDFARNVARRAIEHNEWVYDVDHGGGAANAYGFKADTECVLAVSSPEGLVVYWTARAPANKVTYRGAAEACYPGAGDIFDLRVTDEIRIEACKLSLRKSHEEYVGPLLRLAATASEESVSP